MALKYLKMMFGVMFLLELECCAFGSLNSLMDISYKLIIVVLLLTYETYCHYCYINVIPILYICKFICTV